jgi:hypothetical protein
MVKRGREIRNQSQVWVVGMGTPVVGWGVVVGLLVSRAPSPKITVGTYRSTS